MLFLSTKPNNVQVVKSKTTKKKEKHENIETAEIMDSKQPSPLRSQPKEIKRVRLYFPSDTDTAGKYTWLLHAGLKHPGAEFRFSTAAQSHVVLKYDQQIVEDLITVR